MMYLRNITSCVPSLSTSCPLLPVENWEEKGGPKAALVSMASAEDYSAKSPAVRVNRPLSLMTKSAVVLPLTSARTIVVFVPAS